MRTLLALILALAIVVASFAGAIYPAYNQATSESSSYGQKVITHRFSL